MVVVPADALAPFPRFSLYNSPYPAHDRGCAVDLYPESGVAPSPVAGEVLDTRTVRCPPREYAVDHDHLILVDADERVARILHVDPAVEPGGRVAVGDPLGETVRSGFFGRWVDDHVHLGFRPTGENPYRASGSLPVTVDADVRPVAWDGRGTVVETGPTHVLLDAPRHPDPGGGFVALAADDGTPLDGGLVHYAGGGALNGDGPADDASAGRAAREADGGGWQADGGGRPLDLLGTRVGVARGRDVEWADVAVLANGERATGLSLFAAREQFGAKLVFHEGHEFAVGDDVKVALRPTADPVRLG